MRSINGKENELDEEFAKAELDILTITETKKKGQGEIELKSGHTLIYSGVDDSKRAAAGVGCIIKQTIADKVQKWEAHSERILVVELKVKKDDLISIVTVYGPNEDENKKQKDKFWEELTLVVENCKGKTFITGDLNGRTGTRDNTTPDVIGKFGEQTRNNNGARIIDFCVLNNYIITNTFYQHKEIHKFTRVEVSRNEKSIIDYILVERENRRNVIDVKVRRSAEINSDHYLLVAKVKNELITRQTEKHQTRKENETINVYKLKDKEKAEEYVKEIESKIDINRVNLESESLEKVWKTFKEILINTARTICGTRKTSKNKKETPWWNDKIKEQIKLKKESWKRYLNSGLQEDYNLYKVQRIVVKNIVLEAKQKAWKQFGEEMERRSKEKQKLFYGVLKSLEKNKTKQSTAIKSEKGEILTDEAQIMERWKEYFQNLLGVKCDSEKSSEQQHNEEKIADGEIETQKDDISEDELNIAIKNTKIGKAPGHDKISGEMVKYMGDKGREVLRKIFNKVWNSKTIPKDWEIGIILPIFKKGDNRNCTNYRGITLLSTALKIYERILERRLRTLIEHTLTETQSGFRRDRSVHDHVFTLKETISKTLQKGTLAYFAFIDLEKAFDKVPRKYIWESLTKRKIPENLIKAIQSLYGKNVSYVICKNMKSETFITKEGLRQGGVMSPVLFTIYMDDIIKECNTKIKKLFLGYKNLQRVELSECAFADDIVIMANNENDLQTNVTAWNETLNEYGMKINNDKTKVMVIASEQQQTNIQINNTRLEQVHSFQYLGVTLQDNGRQDIDINKRVEKTAKLYHAWNRSFIAKSEVTRETKMTVYKTCFRPVLTYGCESWVLTQGLQSKIQATEMKYLRRILGVTRKDHIRNQTILEELKIPSVLEFIERRQLSWWGHLHRMSNNRPVKQAWDTKIIRKKKRGRPRATWDNNIGRILAKKGKTWSEAKILTTNRKQWRKFVSNQYMETALH